MLWWFPNKTPKENPLNSPCVPSKLSWLGLVPPIFSYENTVTSHENIMFFQSWFSLTFPAKTHISSGISHPTGSRNVAPAASAHPNASLGSAGRGPWESRGCPEQGGGQQKLKEYEYIYRILHNIYMYILHCTFYIVHCTCPYTCIYTVYMHMQRMQCFGRLFLLNYALYINCFTCIYVFT